MTLDDVTNALFPKGHSVQTDEFGVVHGRGTSAAGIDVGIVGIVDGKAVGIEAACAMAGHVLAHIRAGDATPLVMLVDTQSQLMGRREELLGLNEYLSHLAKTLILASMSRHRTVGVLYGKAAAGAFIATALATDTLVALPGADPSVMDLPSIARITKLPIEKLKDMATRTPIFAPGIDHIEAVGGIAETWSDSDDYAAKFDCILKASFDGDHRDVLGEIRKGRVEARKIAQTMHDLASAAQ